MLNYTTHKRICQIFLSTRQDDSGIPHLEFAIAPSQPGQDLEILPYRGAALMSEGMADMRGSQDYMQDLTDLDFGARSLL